MLYKLHKLAAGPKGSILAGSPVAAERVAELFGKDCLPALLASGDAEPFDDAGKPAVEEPEEEKPKPKPKSKARKRGSKK